MNRYFEDGPPFSNDSYEGYGVKTVGSFSYGLQRARSNHLSAGGLVVEFKLRKDMNIRAVHFDNRLAPLSAIAGVPFAKHVIMKILKEKYGIHLAVDGDKIHVLDLTIVNRPATLREAVTEMYEKMINLQNPREKEMVRYEGGYEFYNLIAQYAENRSQKEQNTAVSPCAKQIQFFVLNR